MSNSPTETIFEKILNKQIPCKVVYEDEHTLAFHDVNPQAPVHVLVIPKTKLVNVAEASEEDAFILGKVLLAAKKVAEITGIHKTGYRLVMNNGAGSGQTVFYLHCHVIGGRNLSWPPG